MTHTRRTTLKPAVNPDTQTAAADRTFTARGSRNGSQVWIRWTEGDLDGDPPTIDLIRAEADIGVANTEDPILGAGFARACRDAADHPLADPRFVHLLVQRVFDNVRETSCSPTDLLRPPTP